MASDQNEKVPGLANVSNGSAPTPLKRQKSDDTDIDDYFVHSHVR